MEFICISQNGKKKDFNPLFCDPNPFISKVLILWGFFRKSNIYQNKFQERNSLHQRWPQPHIF